MLILPAIDLYEGKAVRLYKGDYDCMTVYSENPTEVALDFQEKGAQWIHLVDLEGAKDGTTPNIKTVEKIAKETSLFVEIGGGIRNIETVERYIKCGVNRVILGTAAVNDEQFLKQAIDTYKDKIAVAKDFLDRAGFKPKDEVNLSGELNNPFAGLTTEELKKLTGDE